MHTDALLVYEFLPPALDANIGTLEGAIALVEEVAQPNARLLLDTWHLAKAALSPADMRIVPVGSIGWVELADGLFEASSSLAEEAVGQRRLPGEGEFDIGGYIDAWRACGYDRRSRQLASSWPMNPMTSSSRAGRRGPRCWWGAL